jgi:hypothetical protein
MSLDDALFSDENKALMIAYIKSAYCVVDPSPVDGGDETDDDDLDTVSADWSPVAAEDEEEINIENIASALGVDSTLIISLGRVNKRHREAELEVARLRRAMDEAVSTLRLTTTELEETRKRVKDAI